MKPKPQNTLLLEGKVFSGKGEGTKFISLPWVKKQITEKLGFTPYLGTLNIELTKNSVRLKTLDKKKAIEISPPAGFCRGRCFRARLENVVDCAIVIPEVPDYSENIVEVIADTNLREALQLKDGSMVQIEIMS